MVGRWFASDFHRLVTWALSVIFAVVVAQRCMKFFWTRAGRVMKNVKSAKMYGNASPIPRPLAPQLSLEIPRKTLVRGRASLSPSGSSLKKWKLSRRRGRLYQSGDQA